MNQLTFSADVRLQASSDNKPPRVEIRAYTGGVMRVPGFGPVVLDVLGMELSDVLLLADHENLLGSIAGHGTPEVRGGELYVVGTLAVGTAAADQILALHRSGVKLQASIGAEPSAQQFVEAGEQVAVNGRNILAPRNGFQLITKSTLREVSFVAAGADSQTSVSIAAQRRAKAMTDSSFHDFVASMLPGTSIGDLTSDQAATLHANYQGRTDASDGDFAAVAPFIAASAFGDEVAAEHRRLAQIDAACKGSWGEHADTVQELKATAVGGSLGVDDLINQLREIRMEKLMATLPNAHTVYGGRRDPQPQIIEASLCLLGGLPEPEKHFDERTLDAADRYRKGMSLQTVLMQAACENGYRSRPGESINDGNLRRVLEAVFAPIRATGFTSVDYPNVLSNVASKNLLQGFQEVGDEWRSISEIKPVKNFKEATFVRLLDNLPYEQVAPGGMLTHGTLGDDAMTGQAATYGTIVEIDRQHIINDDLSALTDIPRRLGRQAAMKLRRLFWAAFMAADGHFHAGNGNLLTTGTVQLDDAGLAMQNALIAFRAQRSPAADGSKLLGGAPSVCLVSPNDEIAVRRLLNSSSIVAGGSTSVGTVGSANPFFGLAQLVVCDWLADESLGGDADGRDWYLFRASSFLPAMLVLALNGRVEPTVETSQADFNTLGIAMRGYSDIGVARGETLAGLKIEVTETT